MDVFFYDLHTVVFVRVKFEVNRISLKISNFFDFFDDVIDCPTLVTMERIDWMVFLSSTYLVLCPCKISSRLEHFKNFKFFEGRGILRGGVGCGHFNLCFFVIYIPRHLFV